MATVLRIWLFVSLLGLTLYVHAVPAIDSLRPAPADTSVSVHYPDEDSMEDDFSPGLFFFAMVGIAIVVLSAVVLTVLALLALLVLVVFMVWGVVATSVLVGVYKKSFQKGFKTFWVLGISLVGAACAALLALFADWIFDFPQPGGMWATLGAGCGFLGGLALGLVSFELLRRLLAYLINRFGPKTKSA